MGRNLLFLLSYGAEESMTTLRIQLHAKNTPPLQRGRHPLLNPALLRAITPGFYSSVQAC